MDEVDAAYASHQLEVLHQSVVPGRLYTRQFANTVREHGFDPRTGAHPLFSHCADIYDALLALDAQVERDSKDVLATPLQQLAQLDCKAVTDLRKQLDKATAKEEALNERLVAARKRDKDVAKVETEYDEARRGRQAMQASYEARSKALLLAWHHDSALAILSHLEVLRAHHARMADALQREGDWLMEQLERTEVLRARELDGMAASGAAYQPRPSIPAIAAAQMSVALQQPPQPPATSTQGALKMWSPKASAWKWRWLCVDDCRVAIFKRWRDGWPHKVRVLTSWSRVTVSGVGIVLETDAADAQQQDRVATKLEAATANDARDWHALLAAMIESAHTRDSATFSRQSTALRLHTSDRVALLAAEPLLMFPSSLEATQALLDAHACSECGAIEGGALWCCVQFGIVMCAVCAEAFKQSGFRSILPVKDADTVSLQLLLCTGNALGAALWEGSKEALRKRPRPDVSSSVAARVAWIHTKYADRAFVASSAARTESTLAALLENPAGASTQDFARVILCEIAYGRWNPDAVNGATGQPVLHRIVDVVRPPAQKVDVILLLALLNGAAQEGRAPNSGDTGLHVAMRLDRVEAARLLLLQGADENARNQSGETPKSLARGRCAALFDAAATLDSSAPRIMSLTARKPLGQSPAASRNAPVPATAATSPDAELEQFLQAAAAADGDDTALPPLSLASYESADLSVLSPRARPAANSQERPDIMDAKSPRSPRSPRVVALSGDGGGGAAPSTTSGNNAGATSPKLGRAHQRKRSESPAGGPLGRDEQQRALVESAKKTQAKKRRNAAFIKLRDNIKFAVAKGPRARSDVADGTDADADAAAAAAATSGTESPQRRSPRGGGAVERNSDAGRPLSARGVGELKPAAPKDPPMAPLVPPESSSSSSTGSSPRGPLKPLSASAPDVEVHTVTNSSGARFKSPRRENTTGNLRAAEVVVPPPPTAVTSSSSSSSVVAGSSSPPPPTRTPHSFEERLHALLALRRTGAVDAREFTARLAALCGPAPGASKEEGVERRASLLREMHEREMLSLAELEVRLGRLLRPPPPVPDAPTSAPTGDASTLAAAMAVLATIPVSEPMRIVASFSRVAQDKDELSFDKGETLTVVGAWDPTSWATAENAKGARGLVPANFFKPAK